MCMNDTSELSHVSLPSLDLEICYLITYLKYYWRIGTADRFL